MLMSPHLDSHSTHFKCYQLSKLKIEFKVIERMYEALHIPVCVLFADTTSCNQTSCKKKPALPDPPIHVGQP